MTAEERERGKWIPVRERLPIAGSIVLALWDSTKWSGNSGESPYHVCEYNGRLWHEPGDDENDYSTPKYWQPLPPPPAKD